MIRVLDKTVSDKIAAGEVVDRPLSIVKELVENSIDSGATSIICEIKNGGKTYIRVTDNGCGIPENEAELAFRYSGIQRRGSGLHLRCIPDGDDNQAGRRQDRHQAGLQRRKAHDR